MGEGHMDFPEEDSFAWSFDRESMRQSQIIWAEPYYADPYFQDPYA